MIKNSRNTIIKLYTDNIAYIKWHAKMIIFGMPYIFQMCSLSALLLNLYLEFIFRNCRKVVNGISTSFGNFCHFSVSFPDDQASFAQGAFDL